MLGAFCMETVFVLLGSSHQTCSKFTYILLPDVATETVSYVFLSHLSILPKMSSQSLTVKNSEKTEAC